MSNEDFSNNHCHNQQLQQYQSLPSIAHAAKCETAASSSLTSNFAVNSAAMPPTSIHEFHHSAGKTSSSPFSQVVEAKEVSRLTTNTSPSNVPGIFGKDETNQVNDNHNQGNAVSTDRNSCGLTSDGTCIRSMTTSTSNSNNKGSDYRSSFSSPPFDHERGQEAGQSHNIVLSQFSEVATTGPNPGMDNSKQTVSDIKATSTSRTPTSGSTNGGENGASNTSITVTTHDFNQQLQCTNSYQEEECAQKRKNSAGDMFGNFLHSNSSLNNDLKPEKKPAQKKKTNKTKPKRDRSHLRKGKWTPEEEEYTTMIINHFRSGLLTLPEGVTLRSYIAQKLTCDPMRITKKFAGASCLGKRVYHLRERSQYSIHDIEMAKAELNGLERRFRLRVEEGNTHGLSSQSTESILRNTNQAAMNNSFQLVSFPFTPTPAPSTMNPVIDPAWLAKYASTLGASTLSAPGLSSFVLQFIAAQQFQQAQAQVQTQAQAQSQQCVQQKNQQCHQVGNDIKPKSEIQPKQQELSPQVQMQQSPQHKQQQMPIMKYQHHISNSASQYAHQLPMMGLPKPENDTKKEQQQQAQENILPLMSMQSQLNPTVLSQLLINQTRGNTIQPNPSPQCLGSTIGADTKQDNGQHHSQSSTIVKPILNQFIPTPVENKLQSQQEEQVHSIARINQPLQNKHSTGQDVADLKKKHSKEDVDAGKNFLIFIEELRRNHKEALNAPVSNNGETMKENNQHAPTDSNTNLNGGFSHSSTSTAGLISETKSLPGHDQNNFNSISYGPTISFSANKDESVKSELSNESSSSYVSSEDDQKIYIESGSGPIRKRFRRHGPEFSSENVKRHDKSTRHND